MRSGSTSRPRYVLQVGHMRCASFGWLQVGQTCTRGAAIPCCARRLSRLDLDVFRFGTAIAAAQYSGTGAQRLRGVQSAEPVRSCKESARFLRSPKGFTAWGALARHNS